MLFVRKSGDRLKHFLRALIEGMSRAVSFHSSALYRYPYRNSAEAMRGDWSKIGRDVESALSRNGEDDERI